MPTKIEFNTKELKEILKTFGRFANLSQKAPTVTITFDPVRMVMVTDHAYVSARPKETIVTGDKVDYTFNPDRLLGLTLRGDTVSLGWADDGAPMELSNGALNASLRVAVLAPDFQALPTDMAALEVPLGVLAALSKYLSVPFAYHQGKKELMAVRLTRDPEGFLRASADDGYSLAKITTKIRVEKPLDIKIPKYMFDCLYSKTPLKDETVVGVGVNGFNSMLTNGLTQVYTSGMVEESPDFDVVLAGFKPRTSFSFTPKVLSSSMKPLMDLIPKKDRAGTVIKATVADGLTMSVKHVSVGEAVVDSVDEVDEIYNEGSERIVPVTMHPKAFSDYTSLFEVDRGKMYANHQMVQYEGTAEAGGCPLTISYLFPTVQE